MIDYKSCYQKMNALLGNDEVKTDQGNLKFLHFPFQSELLVKADQKGVMNGNLFYHELVDGDVPENTHFEYPVLVPEGEEKYKKGILLLHGLNEKSWDKYLAWAAELAERLKRPVILFPIAYHMNRAPKNWSNPRMMKGVVQVRKEVEPKGEATFANAALSTRLGAHPEQFVYSGVQSYYDIWKLVRQISDGQHSVFSEGAGIDVFAYSIGAFLAEILFMSNPEKLFSHSRLFIFAGGPTFDSMMGTSRYIMDLTAFKRLRTLRHKKVLKHVYRHLVKKELPAFDQTWTAFYAMIYLRKGRKLRKAWLEHQGTNIYAVALEKDRVMQAKNIIRTLKGRKKRLHARVDVIDFPYAYTHENPFPLSDDKNLLLVDRCFSIIMDKAVRFYKQAMPVFQEINAAEEKKAMQWAKG